MPVDLSPRLAATDEDLRTAFGSLRTRRDVAMLLDVPYAILTYYIYRCPVQQRYRVFEVPKRTGGSRTISAPVGGLKIIQGKLNQVFQAVYRPKACAHGFVRGRSVRSNANQHCGRRYVLNVDLEEFFPSINLGRVRGLLMAVPYGLNAEVATVLAQICCWNGRLPQGAPTSPVVSNMICAKMDTQLRRLANQHKCIYTRYADDLTFSTNLRNFPPALAHVVASHTGESITAGKELLRTIELNGFHVNHDKTRLQRKTERQEVTGITTNRFPNVSRKYVRQVRAMIHDWKANGYAAAEENFLANWDSKHRKPERDDPAFLAVLLGKLEYLKMVKGRTDTVYANLVTRARACDTVFARLPIAHDALWIVESQNRYQGTAFVLEGVGLVSCAHVIGDDTEVFQWHDHETRHPVEIIAINTDIDLCLMRVPVERAVALPRGDSRKIRTNDPVTLLGFPRWHFRQPVQVSPGVVTGRRPVHGVSCISITPQVIKGNSGGPVLNQRGEVVAVAVTGADQDPPDYENGAVEVEALERLIEVERERGVAIPDNLGLRAPSSGATRLSRR